MKKLTRRGVLKRSLKTSIWAVGITPYCTTLRLMYGADFWDEKRYHRTLRAAADEIIPSVDDMPAASQVKVINYISLVLEKDIELLRLIVATLDWLQNQSQTRFGRDFYQASSEQRIDLLKVLERGAQGSEIGLLNRVGPDLFVAFRNLVYEAYYTNPEVWPAIGYEFHSTGGIGPAMKPFDESILDEVCKRPRYYREIPNEEGKT